DHLGKEATEAAAWPSFPLGTTLRNPFNRQFWAGLFSPAPRICGARSGVRSLGTAGTSACATSAPARDLGLQRAQRVAYDDALPAQVDQGKVVRLGQVALL